MNLDNILKQKYLTSKEEIIKYNYGIQQVKRNSGLSHKISIDKHMEY